MSVYKKAFWGALLFPVASLSFLGFLVTINHLVSRFKVAEYPDGSGKDAAFQFFYEQGVQNPSVVFILISILLSAVVTFITFKSLDFLAFKIKNFFIIKIV